MFGYVCRCTRRFGGQKAASSRPPSGELGLQVVVNFRFYCLKLNSGLLQEQCTLTADPGRASERASEHLEQVCLDVGRVPICIPAFQKPMQEDCYKSQASQRTPFLKTSSSDNRQANKTAANPNKPRTNVAAQPFQKVECLLSSMSLWVLFLWVIVFVLVNTVEMCEEIVIIEREWTTWIHGIGVGSDGIGSLMGYWSTSQRQLTWKVSQGLQSFNRHSVLKMRESPIRSSKTWTS